MDLSRIFQADPLGPVDDVVCWEKDIEIGIVVEQQQGHQNKESPVFLLLHRMSLYYK